MAMTLVRIFRLVTGYSIQPQGIKRGYSTKSYQNAFVIATTKVVEKCSHWTHYKTREKSACACRHR
jgi:hypothetical protein